MKTTIDIPEPLYKKVKFRAIERGQTLKQVVLTSLEHELERGVHEEPTPYFARRKLHPDFKKLAGHGSLKLKAGDKSIDGILDEIKDDSNA